MGNTQGGTGLVYTGQHGLHSLSPGQTDGAHVAKDWFAGRGTVSRCSERQHPADHVGHTVGHCAWAAVPLWPKRPHFQALRLSPLGRHLLSTAGKGRRCLMLPQSSRHRGECVLGAAVCYKYTSESEKSNASSQAASLPSSSIAWGPSPPQPAQSGLLFKPRTLNKGRLDGLEGDKRTPLPKVDVTSLEDC